jgi:ABC-2 type transport system ATP-binding protein
VDVLRDVTFQVNHGEIFGFVGPNGAGKTTTIRVMATLLEPMAGRVDIDGIDVAIDPERVRRIIGYMPDHAGVYDRITVREYLEFFADAFGAIDINVVDAVIELTELGNLQERLVAVLSKGMKQRLQLARTLLHDPKVLILDEPASDLDPRARIEIRDLLLELRELGKTVFLSSHILTELSDVCTSVGILERGRLLVAGPVSEIADRLRERQARAASGGTAGPIPAAVAFDPPVAGGPPASAAAALALPVQSASHPPPAVTAHEQQGARAAGVGSANAATTGAAGPPLPPAESPPVAAAHRPPASAEPGPATAHAAESAAQHQPAAAEAEQPLVARPPEVTAGGAPIPASTHKRLKLRVLGDARPAAALLVGGSGVLGVETGPSGQLIVHFTGDERFAAQLVRHLCTHGVDVVGVEPERNQLERIFLEVTRGELQ